MRSFQSVKVARRFYPRPICLRRVASSAAFQATQVSAPSTMTSEAKDRANQAVLGAFVSDAACMPLHWIYDLPKMSNLLKSVNLTMDQAAFFPELSCPYYKAKAVGDQSPYGYELFPLISSLSQCVGTSDKFDPEAFSHSLVTFFTSDERKESVYRNQSIKLTLENYEKGKRGVECGHEKDFQANCFAKVDATE